MNASSRRASAVAILVSVIVSPISYGALLQLETRQWTWATICVENPRVCNEVNGNTTNSTSHSNNFDGNLMTPTEARTAGRAGISEIAANASIRYRGNSRREYAPVVGRALFEIDLVALNVGEVFLDFHLPPGFIEIQSNAEWRDNITFFAAISAEIGFCRPACAAGMTTNDLLFRMSADLEGGWLTHQLATDAHAFVGPPLDTSPLEHQNVAVADDGFTRTKTWEYEAFSGRLRLGRFHPGETFSVGYEMFGSVESGSAGFGTWAAAAINDPFFLSSDPLPQVPIFEFTQVPEPAGAALAVMAAAFLGSGPGRRRIIVVAPCTC